MCSRQLLYALLSLIPMAAGADVHGPERELVGSGVPSPHSSGLDARPQPLKG